MIITSPGVENDAGVYHLVGSKLLGRARLSLESGMGEREEARKSG